MYRVALHIAHSILSLPVVAGPKSKTIPSIVACSRVVTLRVTLAIPNLCNSTVAKDKPLSEAGVFHGVHSQIQGDVVRAKGLGQSLVLELDLGFGDGGIPAIVIGKVDNTVANALVLAELPVVVVGSDYVNVVTCCEATGRRTEGGHHFLFRDRYCDDPWVEANFVWSPLVFHLKVNNIKTQSSIDFHFKPHLD